MAKQKKVIRVQQYIINYIGDCQQQQQSNVVIVLKSKIYY